MPAPPTRPTIAVADIQRLPCYHQAIIPPEYLDEMDHMNVRHYMGLFDSAAWPLFTALGMDPAYYREQQGATFALEHHIRYLAEVRSGQTVAVHGRLLGRTAKRLHLMMFMVNTTTHTLAATLEAMTSHGDMIQRRTSPFPPAIAARIDSVLAQHQQLTWTAQTCGVMAP